MKIAHRPPAQRLEIDFRTEVLLAPTPGMWEAMRNASSQLGWPLAEGDATVAALEEVVSAETGHDGALFVATTSLANILGLLALCRPGSQVIMGARSHQYWYERRNVSALARCSTRLIRENATGELPLSELEQVLEEAVYGARAPTAVIALENTHNVCGGTCLSSEYLAAVRNLADTHSVAIFIDGARILNATVALDEALSDLCGLADAVSFSLNKGLGAPFGAMLCGRAQVIEAARESLAMFGALSIHRAGMFAAAALHALKHERVQLAEDHALARLLADVLSEIEDVNIDLDCVQTNIVRVELRTGLDAAAVVGGLADGGVGATVLEPHAIRFVAHRGVSEHDVPRVKEALISALRSQE
jgi:threonine aldolase